MARRHISESLNYMQGSPTVIKFTSTTGITHTTTRGTEEIVSTPVATQTTALKLQNTTGGTLGCDFDCVLATCTPQASYNATGSPYVQLCVYVADPVTSDGGDGHQGTAVVFGSGDLTATNRATITFGSANSGAELRRGWNVVSVPRHEATSVGATFSWSNITHIRFPTDVTTLVTGANGGPFYIDSIVLNAKCRPKAIITFDDGFDSVYDNAYPIMAALGFAGVAYVGRDYGTEAEGYMTVAELTTLQNAGWDIGNHELDSTGLNATASNITSVITAMESNRDWLISQGFTKAARHIAYVGGAHYPDADVSDMTFVNAIEAAGFLSGRTIDDRRRNAYGAIPSGGGFVEGWHRLFSHTITDAVATSTVENRVKDAIDRGINYTLCYHKVQDGGGTAVVSIANFTTEMNMLKSYVDKGQIDVITMSEFYNGMTGTRRYGLI